MQAPAHLLQRDRRPQQLLAARACALGVFQHRGYGGAVLAQQALQRREALFHRLQPGRHVAACLWPHRRVAPVHRSARALGGALPPLVGPLLPLVEPALMLAGEVRSLPRARRLGLGQQPLAVVTQLAGEIPRLDRQRVGALGERVERRIDAGEGIQARGGIRAQRRRPGRVGAPVVSLPTGERLGGAGGGREQRIETAQPLALGAQLLLLALPRSERVDLGELVLDQVELALTRAVQLPQALQLLTKLTHLAMGGRASGAPGGLRGAAEAVEDLQLRGGERELAVLVLAVEGQQRLPDPAQVGDGDRAAVHVRAGAPVGAHAPCQHNLLGIGRQQLPVLPVA
ncbi:MAG TPA: hypothetical protein VG147_12030 [Solirubrobacteraceae bacterium]|nr:hypothetical protein [Solirubrobacteraceae bacterium]